MAAMGDIGDRRCTRCGKPVKWLGNPHRPFCSVRCRIIDLGNWAMGRYKIPGQPVSDSNAEDDSKADESEKQKS